MTVVVFWAVLSAALLHAGWNAVVKIGLDRFSAVLLLALVQATIAFVLLPFVTAPTWAAWIWIAGSAILHTGYKISLVRAYGHGDLSQIYPVARGAAPLIVAACSIPLFGEALTPTATFAVVAIALGAASMSFKSGAQLERMPAAAIGYALTTAAFTASYTIVDGMGARVAESASGFILWMAIGDAIAMMIYAAVSRRGMPLRALIPALPAGLAAGAMSLGSYWIAVWAFTKAPIALVAALRETSVLFAMLIAAVCLKEPTVRWRWVAAGAIAGGLVLLRL